MFKTDFSVIPVRAVNERETETPELTLENFRIDTEIIFITEKAETAVNAGSCFSLIDVFHFQCGLGCGSYSPTHLYSLLIEVVPVISLTEKARKRVHACRNIPTAFFETCFLKYSSISKYGSRRIQVRKNSGFGFPSFIATAVPRP